MSSFDLFKLSINANKNVLEMTGVIKSKPFATVFSPQILFLRVVGLFGSDNPFLHVASNAQAVGRMPREQRGL